MNSNPSFSPLSNSAILYLTKSLLITGVTKKTEELITLSASQLLNKSVFTLFSENSCKNIADKLLQFDENSMGSFHLFLDIICSDKATALRPVSALFHHLHNGNKNDDGFILILNDKLSSPLHDQMALHALNIGVIAVDEHYHITSFNSAAEKISGWHTADVLGKTTGECFGEDLGSTLGPVFQSIHEHITIHGTPCNLLRKNETFTPVNISAAPIFNRKNTLQGAIITLHDNTQVITNSFILNSLADGVFTVDKNWVITFFNRAAEELTGFHADEAIGKSCSEVFKTSICGKSCAIAESIYLGSPVYNRSLTIHDINGNKLPVSISAAPLTDMDGNIIGGVEILRDLTTISRQKIIPSHKYYFDKILSKNTAMKHLFQIIPDIAVSPSNVMITGESGTGKELTALALHNNSERKDKAFIAVNCGALPETLLESELFGYKAGAFTDARKDKEGRFAAAEGGTLFLDEIGDIPAGVQTKLLRVLQERVYEPLGSNTPVATDIRIITATNKDLQTAVKTGIFREDLFYRLSVVQIHLPPLRERKDDIPLLIEHFIDKHSRRQGKDIVGITNSCLNMLMNYNFPGNIRELENIIEYAFILCEGSYIQPSDLPEPLAPTLETHSATTTQGSNEFQTLEEMEKQFILSALQRNNWKKMATCKEIGVSKDTLRRKIQKYDLETIELQNFEAEL